MSKRIIDISAPQRGNTGQWGRTITYEVDTPLGPTPIVTWKNQDDVPIGSEVCPHEKAERPCASSHLSMGVREGR